MDTNTPDALITAPANTPESTVVGTPVSDSTTDIAIEMPCRLAISSMSLGYADGHSLEHRLDEAMKCGYAGIELYIGDLEHLALTYPVPGADLSELKSPTPSQLARAAVSVSNTCAQRGLKVICLQPFRHYEGLLDRGATSVRLEELKLWCDLAGLLDSDLILIPSNFLPADRLADGIETVIHDLREAAGVAAAADPPVRLCYEALSWGTRVDTAKLSWDIVERVDHPNLGLCLDTFNIAARVYADPAIEGGVQANGPANMEFCLQELAGTVDPARVFLVQVADGERLSEPLVQGHRLYNPEQPGRLSWSRNHRLFYGETERGAYLPIQHIADVIFHNVGYRGWVSMELFNHRMSDRDESVPHELATRGALSWKKLVQDVQLPVADIPK